jgi:hypothetical protein
MWGRLSSLPVRRTFQSGLEATGKSPQLADKNVCPMKSGPAAPLANSEFKLSLLKDWPEVSSLFRTERTDESSKCSEIFIQGRV